MRGVIRRRGIAARCHARMEGEMHPEWWFAAVPALCAGALMPVAISARSIGHDHADGLQAMHVSPTSRLGGTILYIAFATAIGVLDAVRESGPVSDEKFSQVFGSISFFVNAGISFVETAG